MQDRFKTLLVTVACFALGASALTGPDQMLMSTIQAQEVTRPIGPDTPLSQDVEESQQKELAERSIDEQTFQEQVWQQVHSMFSFERTEGAMPGDTEACKRSSDCSDKFEICIDSFCQHKKVFDPSFYAQEWAGVLVFSFVMALCNIAGIGGGGIAIPLIIGFFHFETKSAVAISSFTILICTTMRYIYNFRDRNPEKPDTVVVDYSLAVIMMPTTLAGSQLGAMVLNSFPAVIIQTMLTLLLIFLSWTSTKKAIQIGKKEKMAREQKQSDMRSEGGVNKTEIGSEIVEDGETSAKKDLGLKSKSVTPNTKGDAENDSVVSSVIDAEATDEFQALIQQSPNQGRQTLMVGNKRFTLTDDDRRNTQLDSLKNIADAEKGHSQWWKQIINGSLIIAAILMNIFMGSSSMASPIGIELCSAAYWGVQLIFIIWCVIACIIAVKWNQQEQILKRRFRINYNDHDVRFEGKTLRTLLLIGGVGGWVAGALGLGGGSIYNPALLSLGVHPRVSGATGMYLVLFSTINACTVNAIHGTLTLGYGCWIGFWACLGSLLGLIFADWYVKKSGRQSFFVWVLVVVFIISAVMTPIFGGLSIKQSCEAGNPLWGFCSVCQGC